MREAMYRVVFLKSDHPCARCRQTIKAGERTLEVLTPMYRLDPWGHEIPIRVPVRYHPGHRPRGLGKDS